MRPLPPMPQPTELWPAALPPGTSIATPKGGDASSFVPPCTRVSKTLQRPASRRKSVPSPLIQAGSNTWRTQFPVRVIKQAKGAGYARLAAPYSSGRPFRPQRPVSCLSHTIRGYWALTPTRCPVNPGHRLARRRPALPGINPACRGDQGLEHVMLQRANGRRRSIRCGGPGSGRARRRKMGAAAGGRGLAVAAVGRAARDAPLRLRPVRAAITTPRVATARTRTRSPRPASPRPGLPGGRPA